MKRLGIFLFLSSDCRPCTSIIGFATVQFDKFSVYRLTLEYCQSMNLIAMQDEAISKR